jgi:hypothetical protein
MLRNYDILRMEKLGNLQIYSLAFNPSSATVRTIPHTPALPLLDPWYDRKNPTYKIPRLRPHATVIFSFRFMLSSQITNHGRIAKQKSATTNHA